MGRGWGWGSLLLDTPRATTTTPTPPAFASLRRSTLPTRGRVGARCTVACRGETEHAASATPEHEDAHDAQAPPARGPRSPGVPRYPYSQCQTARCRMCPPPLSHSFEPQFCRTAARFAPAALAAPRVSFLLLPPPRGWRSADRRVFLVLVPRWLGRGAHLAIGALASRRSAVAVLGCESPRAPFPALPPEPSRGPRRGARIEPRRRPPTSRSALRRDATPAPPSGSSPETPLMSGILESYVRCIS